MPLYPTPTEEEEVNEAMGPWGMRDRDTDTTLDEGQEVDSPRSDEGVVEPEGSRRSEEEEEEEAAVEEHCDEPEWTAC